MSKPSSRALAVTLALFTVFASFAGPPKIEVAIEAGILEKPYAGRVYIMTTRSDRRPPMNGPNWFNCEPFFSQETARFTAGDTLTIDPETCLGHPCRLADLPAGKYRVQAVIDLNGWSHDVTNAPGNAFSEVSTLDHDPTNPTTLKLLINKTVAPLKLVDRDDLKYIKLRSRLLSEFHKRDVFMQAAVGLPTAYAEETRRKFPTVYTIGGFGSSIQAGRFMARPEPFNAGGVDFVVAYIDADCPTGHHVWADSANNGPWGQALIEELIPHIEQQFRLIAEPTARFVTGHSSGGWSSLWLQVAYPDTFGGCWSLSPDPVDFTAFQTIDIYNPDLNFYTMPDGSPRPVARAGGRSNAPLTNRAFDGMEIVLGRGGQLASFEAVFSPRGPDGRPLRLWDRKTGKLDARVAQAWKKYDIRLIVEERWPTLGPKLSGKLHLTCGDQDTFYLEGAFFKLRDALRRLKSDAEIEVIPDAGHGLSPAVFRKVGEQMGEAYRRKGGVEEKTP